MNIGRTFTTKIAGIAASAMLLASGVVLASAPPALATPSPTITSYSTYDAATSNNTFVGSSYVPVDLVLDSTYSWIANGVGSSKSTNSQVLRMDSSGATVALEVGVPTGCGNCTGYSRISGITADATDVWFGTVWGYVGKVAKSGFSASSTITWVYTGGPVAVRVAMGLGPNGSIWYTDSSTIVGYISNGSFTSTGNVSKCPSNVALVARSFVTLNSRLYALSSGCDAIVELNPATGAPITTWPLSATVGGAVRNIFVNVGTMIVAKDPTGVTDVLWFSAETSSDPNGTYRGFVGWLDPATPTSPPPTASVTALGLWADGATPSGLVQGSDGNFWTIDANQSHVWRVTPAGVVSQFASQAVSSDRIGAAAPGPNGETVLWYNSGGFNPAADWGMRKFSIPATYTVTYNANTGSGTAPTASDFTPPATVTVASQGSLAKSGNIFTGWNTQANGLGTAYAAGATYNAAANATLYAQWAVGKTLTYDANGGQGTPPAAGSAVTGGSLTVLGNTTSMTKSGETFDGWNTQADGLGTAYAAGASVVMNTNLTLYAVWTPVPPSPPTPSSPTSSPTPTAPTSSTPSNPPLAPVLNSTTTSLPPGKGAVTQGGIPVEVTVAPNTSKNGYEFDGDGWKLNLAGILPGGNSAPLNSRGQLEIVQGRGLRTAGTGFAANTTAQVYLLPPTDVRSKAARSKQEVRGSVAAPLTAPLLLGPVQVGADGTFVGTLPVPLTVAPGDYVSQVVGYSPAMQVRTASLGVVLAADKKSVVKRVSTTVYFASGSPVLDSKAKTLLSAAAKKIPKGASKVNVQSIGYVQGTSYTGNDLKLSTARAENVAAQLRRDAVVGKHFVSGRGVATERGSTARRVEVVIAYTVSK